MDVSSLAVGFAVGFLVACACYQGRLDYHRGVTDRLRDDLADAYDELNSQEDVMVVLLEDVEAEQRPVTEFPKYTLPERN